MEKITRSNLVAYFFYYPATETSTELITPLLPPPKSTLILDSAIENFSSVLNIVNEKNLIHLLTFI